MSDDIVEAVIHEAHCEAATCEGECNGRPWITEPGLYDLTEAEYHADMVVGGSLSSSGARVILSSSPARFDYDRRNGQLPKRAFELGHAAHAAVLGAGSDVVVVEGSGKDPNAWNTDKTKAEVAAARAAGKTPIRPKDAVVVREMAAALREHPVVGPLLMRPGKAEQSFVARDPESGVMCRARPDWMPDVDPSSRLIVVDYKTTANAHPDAFARAMTDRGYHLQGPFYCDVLSWLGLDHDLPPRFILVAQEKDPPYLVSYGSPSTRAIEWGRVLNRKARDTYARCVETGRWPGYGDEPAVFDIPGWADHQYDAALDAGAYDTIGDLAS